MSNKGVKENKNKKGDRILENPDVLAEQLDKTEKFLEEKKKPILYVGAAIALIIAGYFMYRYYAAGQEEKAQKEMFTAVYYFENDSLNLALNGDGNNVGFLDIIDDYPLSKASGLANYYAGIIYLKQGDFKTAIDHLKKFSSTDLIVQGRAYALIGDAYSELEDYSSAIDYYNKAINYHPNEHFTPAYLIKAALVYEKMGKLDKAKGCYTEIVDDFKKSADVQLAKKELARLESKKQG